MYLNVRSEKLVRITKASSEGSGETAQLGAVQFCFFLATGEPHFQRVYVYGISSIIPGTDP